MKRWGLWCLVGIICALASPAAAQLKLVQFVAGLSGPVQMVQDPTNAAVQYVVEQGGTIKVIQDGTVLGTPFLNLTSVVLFDNAERGLLSLAFAPDYAPSRRGYVYFINKDGNSVLARFLRST